jgi:hypothetical protein
MPSPHGPHRPRLTSGSRVRLLVLFAWLVLCLLWASEMPGAGR